MDVNKFENLNVEDMECISTNTSSHDQNNFKYRVRNTDNVQQGNYDAKEDTKRQNLNQKKIGKYQRNRIFDCDMCGNRFTDKIILNLHIQVNHMKRSDGYLCTCGKKYKHKSGLCNHVRDKHTNESIICKMCGHESKSFASYRLHLENVHDTNAKMHCEYCCKMFNTSKFATHMRTHTGEKSFSCLYCSKSFSRNSKLKVHERTHTGDKPFSCSYCDKSFTQNSHLKVHKRIHTGEKQFSCSYCDQSFSQRSNLKRHEQTHTGEKQFSCSYCDQSFSQSSTLKRHVRTHTGGKQFSCFHCGQNFGQEQHLQEHEKMHTSEEKCPVCVETFENPDDLLEHMMNHPVDLDSICNSILASFTV